MDELAIAVEFEKLSLKPGDIAVLTADGVLTPKYCDRFAEILPDGVKVIIFDDRFKLQVKNMRGIDDATHAVLDAFFADFSKPGKFDGVREVIHDLMRKAYTEGSNDAFKNLPECVRDMAYKMRLGCCIQDDLAEFKRQWNRMVDGSIGMHFGAALQELERGHKMQRAGWNGSGLWLELQKPDANSKMTQPYIFLCYPEDAKTTPGARVPWTPSQTDMLAKDWQIVN